MDDIVKELQVKCAQAGTNLSEVCRDAGVSRSTIERWKKKPPASITHLRKLEDAIQKRYSENTES